MTRPKPPRPREPFLEWVASGTQLRYGKQVLDGTSDDDCALLAELLNAAHIVLPKPRTGK